MGEFGVAIFDSMTAILLPVASLSGYVTLDKFLLNATLRVLEGLVVLARLLLFAFLVTLSCAADAQCVPKLYSAKEEVLSSVVQQLEASGV